MSKLEKKAELEKKIAAAEKGVSNKALPEKFIEATKKKLASLKEDLKALDKEIADEAEAEKKAKEEAAEKEKAEKEKKEKEEADKKKPRLRITKAMESRKKREEVDAKKAAAKKPTKKVSTEKLTKAVQGKPSSFGKDDDGEFFTFKGKKVYKSDRDYCAELLDAYEARFTSARKSHAKSIKKSPTRKARNQFSNAVENIAKTANPKRLETAPKIELGKVAESIFEQITKAIRDLPLTKAQKDILYERFKAVISRHAKPKFAEGGTIDSGNDSADPQRDIIMHVLHNYKNYYSMELSKGQHKITMRWDGDTILILKLYYGGTQYAEYTCDFLKQYEATLASPRFKDRDSEIRKVYDKAAKMLINSGLPLRIFDTKKFSNWKMFAEGGAITDLTNAMILIKQVEMEVTEDSYEEGEIGASNTYTLDVEGLILSPSEVIETISRRFGLSDNPSDYVINGLNGHDKIFIETEQLQDADGIEPSDEDKELWKKGEKKLYTARYIIGFEVITKHQVPAKEIGQLLGIEEVSTDDEMAKGGTVNEYDTVDYEDARQSIEGEFSNEGIEEGFTKEDVETLAVIVHQMRKKGMEPLDVWQSNDVQNYLSNLSASYKNKHKKKRHARGGAVDHIYYEAEYYDNQGGHGALASFTDFSSAWLKAIELYNREKESGELGKSTGYIGVSGSGDEFAILYLDQSYLDNTSAKDFKSKTAYKSWVECAKKVIETGKPCKGTYKSTVKHKAKAYDYLDLDEKAQTHAVNSVRKELQKNPSAFAKGLSQEESNRLLQLTPAEYKKVKKEYLSDDTNIVSHIVGNNEYSFDADGNIIHDNYAKGGKIPMPYSIEESGGEYYIAKAFDYSHLPNDTVKYHTGLNNEFKTKEEAIAARRKMMMHMHKEQPGYNYHPSKYTDSYALGGEIDYDHGRMFIVLYMKPEGSTVWTEEVWAETKEGAEEIFKKAHPTCTIDDIHLHHSFSDKDYAEMDEWAAKAKQTNTYGKGGTVTSKVNVLDPAYYKTFRLKGNGRREYNIFQSHTHSQEKQAAKQLFPEMTYEEHKAKALEYATAAEKAYREYIDKVETEFKKQFGRDINHIMDYKISGIYTDEFSEPVKNEIRHLLDVCKEYLAAFDLHNSMLRVGDKLPRSVHYAKGGKINKKAFVIDLEKFPDDVVFALYDLNSRFGDTGKVNVTRDSDGTFILEHEDGVASEIIQKNNGEKEQIVWEYLNKYHDKMAHGGKVKFADKVHAIEQRLNKTEVPKKYKKEYGTKYNKETAHEAAQRIAGAIARAEKYSKGKKTTA